MRRQIKPHYHYYTQKNTRREANALVASLKKPGKGVGIVKPITVYEVWIPDTGY